MRPRLLFFVIAGLILLTGQMGLAEPDYTRRPVLMVHGYFPVDAADWVTWGRFKNKLVEDGWPEEYVMTPVFDDTTGCDPTHAREISAWVDELREKTGWDKIDIVAHSAGGLNTMYYLRYFCGVHKVRNFVGLAIAVHGTRMACLDFISCGGEEMCIPKEKDGGWQENSVLAAINTCDETLGDIRYTSIWSDYDEIIVPQEGSILAGAKNIELETPLVEHGAIFLVNESLGYILDALKNKTGRNTDGPGWDCIPQCIIPDTADEVIIEMPPETVEEPVVEVPEEVSSEDVSSEDTIRDVIEGDHGPENDDVTIVPYDPGHTVRDIEKNNDQTAVQNDVASIKDVKNVGPESSEPKPASGCSSSGHGTGPMAVFMLLGLACLTIARQRGLKAR